MAEFEHDGSALAAVKAFLARQEDSCSENEELPDKYIPRPARLGVGANPNQAVHATTSPGLSEANRRLGSALRRQALAAENEDKYVQSSDDEEVESRARAIGAKYGKRQKAERKRPSSANGQKQKGERATSLTTALKDDSDSDGEWGDDVLRRMDGDHDADFKRWSEGFVHVQGTGSHANGDGGKVGGEEKSDADAWVKRKKKKRSRQKNLRRDKRKAHQLPKHLTEETLRAGRVRKSASGKPQFHASDTRVQSVYPPGCNVAK